jgi:hypothetical protein
MVRSLAAGDCTSKPLSVVWNVNVSGMRAADESSPRRTIPARVVTLNGGRAVLRASLLRVIAAATLCAGVCWLPAGAAEAADVSAGGPCWATGYASPVDASVPAILDRGSRSAAGVEPADLSTVQVWRVSERDTLVVQAVPIDPRLAVSVVLFGVAVPLPVPGGPSSTGAEGPWSMALISLLSRRLGLIAQSGSCSDTVVLETGRSPFLTVAGAGGLLLTLLGLVLMLVVALRPIWQVAALRVGAWVAGAGAGLLAGIGAGLWLQQAGPLSPLDRRALLVPLAGLVLGLVASVVGEARTVGRRGSPRRPPLVPGVAVVAELLALVIAVGYAPTGLQLTDRVLTIPRAQAIALETWAAIRSAHANQDASDLDSRFSGEALSWATGVALDTDDATTSAASQPLQLGSLWVPRAAGYPASFLVSGSVAIAAGGKTTTDELFMLFSRSGPDQPWTLGAVDQELAGTSLPRPVLGGQGYAPDAARSRLVPLAMSPDQAVRRYVQYVAEGVVNGPPSSSPFAPGPYTTAVIDDRRQFLNRELQHGLEDSVDIRPGRTEAVFPLARGGALAVVALQEEVHVDPVRARCVHESNDPAHNYTYLDDLFDGVLLFAIPGPTTGSYRIDIAGFDEYHTSTSYGSPC